MPNPIPQPHLNPHAATYPDRESCAHTRTRNRGSNGRLELTQRGLPRGAVGLSKCIAWNDSLPLHTEVSVVGTVAVIRYPFV